MSSRRLRPSQLPAPADAARAAAQAETQAAALARAAASLPDFVPGRLTVAVGTSADYRPLAAFHYRAGPPATWAKVVAVRHTAPWQLASDPATPGRAVAVGVLSWPTAVSRPRREVFGLDRGDFGAQVRFANAHLRTVSRVVVHPQFRGLGLARVVIVTLCELCPTRFVEASAAMGAAHPMFERSGLTRHRTDSPGPAYFWLDKSPSLPFPREAAKGGDGAKGENGSE